MGDVEASTFDAARHKDHVHNIELLGGIFSTMGVSKPPFIEHKALSFRIAFWGAEREGQKLCLAWLTCCQMLFNAQEDIIH